jgi:hypothetical protein
MKKINANISKFNQFRQNISILFCNGKHENQLMDTIIRRFHQLEKANGLITTVKVFKEYYRLVSRYIMYQDVKRQVGPMWVSTNKRGVPKFLRLTDKQTRSLRSNPLYARLVLTSLSIYKLVKHEVDYDISTITAPCKSPKLSEAINRIKPLIPQILKELKFKRFEPVECSPLFVTTKAGANGPKAMGVTSLLDMSAVIEEGLFPSIEKLYDLVFTKKQRETIEEIISSSRYSLFQMNLKHTRPSSRLHFIPEGGGKTRVVCIGDIWSQIALKPIHDFLMKGLKGIPEDGTSSHNNLATKLRDWTKEEEFWCYDLKAATDRMPIRLQEEVLEPLFGGEITKIWSSLLKDRDILYNDELIRYSVGQPMGFLSSWASMALTHHVIIQYVFIINGVKSENRKYCVIGDDMAITGKQVAEDYRAILSDLGMDISKEKSCIPNKNGIPSAEIAKRLFVRGLEITPVTPHQVCLGTNGLNDLLALDRTLSNLGYYDIPFQECNSSDSKVSAPGGLRRITWFTPYLKKMKDVSMLPALLFLTSPLNKSMENDLALLSEVTGIFWTQIHSFQSRFEQHLAVLLAEKIVLYASLLVNEEKYNRDPDRRSEYSPIVIRFFEDELSEMNRIMTVYNTTYVDEEGDGDDLYEATDPRFVYKELLTRPSPLDKPSFQRRVDQKVKQTSSILMNFLGQQRYPKVPSVNELRNSLNKIDYRGGVKPSGIIPK